MTVEQVEEVCSKLSEANLSRSAFIILSTLSRDDTNMTNLARLCHHSTAAATGTVDTLEKRGLVQRVHSVDDRRSILVRLTEQGRNKLSTIAKS